MKFIQIIFIISDNTRNIVKSNLTISDETLERTISNLAYMVKFEKL